MSRRLTAQLRLLPLYWPFQNLIKSRLRDIFLDRLFKPGLLSSLSTWTRPTFDHSEVKIGLYHLHINKQQKNTNYDTKHLLQKYLVRITP